MYEDKEELRAIQERARDLEMAARNVRLAAIARETAIEYGSSNDKQKSLVALIEKRDEWKKVLFKEHITEAEYQQAMLAWTGKKAKALLSKAIMIIRSLE